ncbi:ankyrin-1-like [Belonocnema kinseyi]|uniref:ankyrin-1-like n=1 Tax=Belonocnema kinseyi TaxID=2817044 RepID=UPI00143CD909|nr:ankyrin-1-like [Belonocnema kinseyi]
MEKIRDILHRFEGNKYSETPVSLLYLFQDALSKKQDDIVKALVFPDSPILSVVDSYQTTALHSLCWSFRESIIDVLQALIDLGMNIDAQDSFGNTPLHKAMVSWGHNYTSRDKSAAVALLLKNGAKKNIYNENGVTPIQLALLSGRVEAVELFLTKLEDAQEVDEAERTQHLIKRLFKENNDFHLSSENYSTLLHFLIIQNDVEAFEYVLRNNDFDVNAIKYYPAGYCSFGHTLLHLVVELNTMGSADTPRMIRALVSRGANLNSKPYNKNTPLFFPILRGQDEIVLCLLDCGASINVKVKYNYTVLTPLHCAILKGHLKIVELLVNRGADLEAKNAEGQTALDYSCKSANLDAVKLLLSRGAKINKSTLNLAIQGDCFGRDSLKAFHIIDVLLENGADVNAADLLTMETPLHLACLSNHEDELRWTASSQATIITRLLKSKANVNALDRKALTPLNHALQNHHLCSCRGRGLHEDFRNALKPDLQILIALIAKMIVRKEWVCEENLKLLNDKFVRTIYEECEKEITLMKKNIYEFLNFSFLNILTGDIDDLSGALNNKDLVQVLEVCDYKNNFPIYGEDLEERLQEAKFRQPLMEMGVYLFRKHIKKYISLEVVLEIFRYLHLKDLKNFAEACFVNVQGSV